MHHALDRKQCAANDETNDDGRIREKAEVMYESHLHFAILWDRFLFAAALVVHRRRLIDRGFGIGDRSIDRSVVQELVIERSGNTVK